MKSNRESLIDYIDESSQKIREYSLYKTIPVIIQDPLPDGFDLDLVLSTFESKLSASFMYMVDTVYVGQFDVFIDRQVNAIYEDGAIYVTNHQDDEEDMLDDLVHEVSHSLEELVGSQIYGDDMLEREYLVKKSKLYDILRGRIKGVDSWRDYFFSPSFNQRFDEYLYTGIGYPLLDTLSRGLFLSPYSVTSLREYFAKGFEHFYMRDYEDREYIRKTCPVLYNKINSIKDFIEGNNNETQF